MPYIYHKQVFSLTIILLSLLLTTSGSEAGVEEVDTKSNFREQFIEFHNGEVILAGSLLLPETKTPCPGVVFVHGAGRHTRNSLREVGEHFAANGIAALIYDKRGVRQSSGSYESHQPYTNLVNDALAAVALLKKHSEIDDSQIGIWGLSQGAYISAAAASRSEDIKFVITAGASLADGSFFYYCDNLFQKYGLSNTLRDIAAKAHLWRWDMANTLQDGLSLSSFTPRSYPPPHQYLHPEWSRVNQPVLAMWGNLDQNVPVGESVAGMKNSLAHANNDRWTMIVLPKANHDLGITETGALQSKWGGYAPGALKTMTDWAHAVLNNPLQIDKMKQEGIARNAGILSRYASYEKLRWYGNATVQIVHWILFLTIFLINTIIVAWRCLRRGPKLGLSDLGWTDSLKSVLCVLNFLIVISFSITIVLIVDQLRPGCPPVLQYLPLFGTASVVATIALLIMLARTRPQANWTLARRLGSTFYTVVLILFVPYLAYWNLIGFHF